MINCLESVKKIHKYFRPEICKCFFDIFSLSVYSEREDGSVHSAAGRRVKELEDENGKLKEDLKYERNKSRSSKQETTELKQQLEELKRNHDSSKAKEPTMSVPKP